VKKGERGDCFAHLSFFNSAGSIDERAMNFLDQTSDGRVVVRRIRLANKKHDTVIISSFVFDTNQHQSMGLHFRSKKLLPVRLRPHFLRA
jgi:hypothetical protein